MGWIFDNLGVVVMIVSGIIYVLSSAKKGSEEGSSDPEVAERARKIQEEIRRKILERQQKTGPRPSDPEPTIVFEESPERGAPPPLPTESVEREEDPYEYEPYPEYADPFEEARKELERNRRKAEELRRIAASPQPKRRQPEPIASAVSNPIAQRSFRGDLTDRDSLRRAIVLKEVLDLPVSLR